MSDEKALLAAVWDAPHDDTPRLVYADWLQETGKPDKVARAEFIRVQCELARLDEDDPPSPGAEDLNTWGLGPVECPPSPRRAELLRREAALRKAQATAWKAGVPAKLKSAPYHRGFLVPKLQVVSSRKFLSFTAADLAPAPLWDFAIGYHRTDFPKALASPTFLRVGRLELRGDSRPAPGFTRTFADAPHVRNVARLHPAGMAGEPDALAALLGSPNLPHLTHLQLGGRGVTPPGLARGLAARRHPRPLRGLYLRANDLDDAAVGAVVRAPCCRGLRELSVEENEKVTDAAVVELARSPMMKGLRYLNLAYLPRLTDRSAVALAESPHAANLRVLFLNSAGFGDKGAAALAASPHLGRIEFFAMYDTKTRKSGPAGKAIKKRFGEKVRF